MNANSTKNANTGDDSNMQSEYAKKFAKKAKNKKTTKSSKDKDSCLKTILEQLHNQNSSLSQLIFKWYGIL